MKIDLNDNFKWFLESLLNEGFDQFFIDFYKACPDLEENTEYNIKDFIEGKLVDNNFEFGDKVIINLNGEELNGIFFRKSNKGGIVIVKESNNPLLISNKNIKKAD